MSNTNNENGLQLAMLQAIHEELQGLYKLMTATQKEVLNACEVANPLGVTEGRVRVLASQREIPSYKLGGKRVFSRREIEQYLLSGMRTPSNAEMKVQASQYGDTHLVKQSLSKEARQAMSEEQLNAQPILGNVRPMQAQTQTVGTVQDDDLPF